MGKSALIDVMRANLDGFTVLEVEGDKGSMHQPWTAIDRLAAQVGVPDIAAARPLSTFSAARWLVGVLERGQVTGPVALLADDLQWIDRESASAIAVAVRRLLTGDRVMVVVTTRPPLAPRVWQQIHEIETAVVLQLGEMSTREVAELARREKVRLPRRGDQRLRDHTGGNPLHVRALLREHSEHTWRSRSALPAPRMYVGVVAERLAALPTSARDVVIALAVLQQRSALPVVAHVSGVPDPLEAVGPAIDAALVKHVQDDAATPLRLTHPLVGAAIRQVLPSGVRRTLHARAAEVVAGPAGVEHRVAAAEQFDQALAAELKKLADKAHHRRDMGLAGQYRRWAADLCGDVAVREQWLLDSWYEQLLDGNAPAVASELDAIQTMRPHPKVNLVLGALAIQEGRPNEAVRHLRSALAHEAVHHDAGLTARLRCELGWAYFYAGGSAEDVLTAVEPISDTTALDVDVRESAVVLLALGNGMRSGAPAAADLVAKVQTPEDADTGMSPPVDLLVLRGSLHLARGAPSLAVVDLSRAAMHHRAGQPSRLIAPCYSQLSFAKWLLGEWHEAREASMIGRDTATGVDVAAACAYSAIPVATKGDFATAKRLLTRAGRIVDTVPHPELGAAWSMAGFTIADVTADQPLLRDYLDHPIIPIVRDRMRTWQADWWLINYAQALLNAGRLEQAASVARELPVVKDPTTGIRTMLTRLQAGLAQQSGDHQRALQTYEAAAPHFHDDDAMPLFEAHLRHDHGRLLVALGDRRNGVEQLRAARKLYHRLGALPYLHRAGQELAVAGTETNDSDQRASVLLQSLTERERDIALLVAQGLTNREIAERLFVTSKTVEFHLSNIYAKCGINNRRQLRRRLDRD